MKTINLPFTYLLNLYLDQADLDQILNFFDKKDRQVGNYYLEQLLLNNLLLKISSLLDEHEIEEFFNLIANKDTSKTELASWLDKNIQDCTLTMREVVTRTLIALK